MVKILCDNKEKEQHVSSNNTGDVLNPNKKERTPMLLLRAYIGLVSVKSCVMMTAMMTLIMTTIIMITITRSRNMQ